MTYNQLHSLSEDELCIVLYVINKIDPPCCPKMEFEPRHLVWFKHDMLLHKLLEAGKNLTEDAQPIFQSLMHKLGVKVEFKNNLTEPPVSGIATPNETSS